MWRKLGAASATIIVGAGGTFAADARQNPYEDKGTHYELAVKSDIQQGERVEISKTEPKVDLIFWNDEERVSIKPLFPQTFGAAREEKIEASRPLFSKQMQFKKGDVTAFVEPKEGSESEFDIDFTLDSKPESNVFEYRIEGADQLDFFYQPPLTQEEIDEGASRPNNVIGSYAVYHREKANHRIGDTNYATGKAFHIYRPKAIDADGSEVWAELQYGDGILSVTVLQEWLEKAAYPVRIDPTFGYTSAGATNVNNTVDRAESTHSATPAENANVTSVSYYSDTDSGNATAKGLIYLVSDVSLLAEGSESTITTAEQWWTSTLSLSVSATNYYVGAAWDDGSGQWRYWFDTVGSATRVTDPITYPTVDNPGATAASSRRVSAYATYTADGGGGGASLDDGVVIFD
jgi:hypothetical protein